MSSAELQRALISSDSASASTEVIANTALPLAALLKSVPETLEIAAAAATAEEASDELRILGRFLLHYVPATAAEYVRDLKAFADWCKIKQIGLFDVDRTTIEIWTLGLEGKPKAPRTIRSRVAEDSGPRDEAMVRLLLLNGLRASEVASLRIGDVGEERGHRTITVRRKGGRISIEAVSPATRDAIDRLIAERPDANDDDWLLLTTLRRKDDAGEEVTVIRQMTRHSVDRVTRRLGRKVEISDPPLNPHELRDSFITLGLDAGASLRDMQRAAVHADPRTTADYDRRRKALDTHPSYLVERYLG
jgi:integrase